MNPYRIIATVLALLWTISVYATTGIDTTGADFLKIGAGARNRAMGEAFGSLADDVFTINVNPAGLSNIKTMGFSFMHLEWLDTMDFEFLGFIRPFGRNVIGASVIFFHMPDFIHFGGVGQESGNLNANDLAITIGYGRSIMGISLGGNFKFIHRTLAHVSARAYAVDFGILKGFYLLNLSSPGKNLFLGASLQNLGTKIKFLSEGDPLPLNLKLSLAYNPLRNITIAFDLNKPRDIDKYKFLYNLGAEYKLFNLLALRAGYKFGYDLDTYSFGGGIAYKLGGSLYSFDYALTPLGKDTTHAFSLTITP